jgi:hypothetical protein
MWSGGGDERDRVGTVDGAAGRLGGHRVRPPSDGINGIMEGLRRHTDRSGSCWSPRPGRVKMKTGTAWGSRPVGDLERAATVRRALGDQVELFVDANGAYTRKQAVRLGRRFAAEGVTWFEEPVSSDDLEGLREVRGQCELKVATGDYGHDLSYFQRLCRARGRLPADPPLRLRRDHRLAAPGRGAAASNLQASKHRAQSLHAHAALACQVPARRVLPRPRPRPPAAVRRRPRPGGGALPSRPRPARHRAGAQAQRRQALPARLRTWPPTGRSRRRVVADQARHHGRRRRVARLAGGLKRPGACRAAGRRRRDAAQCAGCRSPAANRRHREELAHAG